MIPEVCPPRNGQNDKYESAWPKTSGHFHSAVTASRSDHSPRSFLFSKQNCLKIMIVEQKYPDLLRETVKKGPNILLVFVVHPVYPVIDWIETSGKILSNDLVIFKHQLPTTA